MANENEKSTVQQDQTQAQAQAQTGLPAEAAGTPVHFEGYDDNQFIDYEKWRMEQVRKAVQRMMDEKEFRPHSDVWSEYFDDNDVFNATEPYGDGHYSTNRNDFFDKNSKGYFENLGFELVHNPKKWGKGDLVGNYDGTDYFPPRMYLGNYTVMDRGKYMHEKAPAKVRDLIPEVKNSYRLRFVGTPEERDKINAHNQAINETAMPGIKYLDYVDEEEVSDIPNETVQFLKKMPKRQ